MLQNGSNSAGSSWRNRLGAARPRSLEVPSHQRVSEGRLDHTSRIDARRALPDVEGAVVLHVCPRRTLGHNLLRQPLRARDAPGVRPSHTPGEIGAALASLLLGRWWAARRHRPAIGWPRAVQCTCGAGGKGGGAAVSRKARRQGARAGSLPHSSAGMAPVSHQCGQLLRAPRRRRTRRTAGGVSGRAGPDRNAAGRRPRQQRGLRAGSLAGARCAPGWRAQTIISRRMTGDGTIRCAGRRQRRRPPPLPRELVLRRHTARGWLAVHAAGAGRGLGWRRPGGGLEGRRVAGVS